MNYNNLIPKAKIKLEIPLIEKNEENIKFCHVNKHMQIILDIYKVSGSFQTKNFKRKLLAIFGIFFNFY